jgi:succinoglycan biosynthesis transport protein ExoP
MELRQLLALLRRWAWLLVVGLILGAAAGFFFSSRQTPIYRASTKMMVIYPTYQSASDYASQYYFTQDLASTYVQMLSTQPVLDAASERVGYKVRASALQTRIISNANIVQIYVDDSDPQRAALIANTLVDVLVQQNEALESSRYTQMEETIQAQISQVESQAADLQTQIDQASNVNLSEQVKQTGDQISSLQNQISILQAEIDQLSQNPASITVEDQIAINEKQALLAQIQPLLVKYQEIYTNMIVLGQPTTGEGSKLTQMQNALDLYQQMHIQLLGNLENVRLARLQSTSTARQIEPATAPQYSIKPRTVYNSLLAGLVGLVIMGVVAFLIEYLDDTLKTARDVKKILDVQILGYIAQMPVKRDEPRSVYVARQPRSPISETFRKLRTNLEFAVDTTQQQTIMVTSSGSGEGKTTIAVNLATIIAHGGKKVLLVDADLRKPTIHKYLGLTNRSGLSNILRGEAEPQSALQQPEGIEGLSVITSGSIPFNPTELLGSEKMVAFLQAFKDIVDVIIIDTPPFVVADSQVLSAKVAGVLIVIKPGHTRAGAAAMMLELLRESGARILGVVLNNIPRNLGEDYGSYYSRYAYKRSYRYYTDDVMPGQDESS